MPGGEDKLPLRDRLREAMLRPVATSNADVEDEPSSVAELEAAVRTANDKERLIGLIAAPLAALIGILIIGALIQNDPAAHLKDGAVNKLHVSLSLYHDLGAVLIVLSVLMLVTALLRKRLFLGIVMALDGLAIFNLHYWGFGVPFIMAGAWYLVRAYRLQRDLQLATNNGRSGPSTRRFAPPSGRYTPPATSSKR